MSRPSDPPVPTLAWQGGVEGHLVLLDQTRLPVECTTINCRTVDDVWQAIKRLSVRGAPAIGIGAAYGVCIGLQSADSADEAKFFEHLDRVAEHLASSRPTAVNLFWALKRMRETAERLRGSSNLMSIREKLLAEAHSIHEEDREQCRKIGQIGAALLRDGQGVLTHCNAGGLATADYGTALAVLFAAKEQGKAVAAYADETRPLLQGARLTSWELKQAGIPVTLICDNMAAQVMREGRVTAIIVGADRIAANGDVANKIGTYGLSVLAKEHGLPFYVAAPASTFDLSIESGEQIPIEQRDPSEVTCWGGRQIAPEGIDVYNPAFDVTPAANVTAIITEMGVIHRPDREKIARVLRHG